MIYLIKPELEFYPIRMMVKINNNSDTIPIRNFSEYVGNCYSSMYFLESIIFSGLE